MNLTYTTNGTLALTIYHQKRLLDSSIERNRTSELRRSLIIFSYWVNNIALFNHARSHAAALL